MSSAVGIDFGEAYSSIGIFRNGVSEVVADSQGERQIPGIVGFYTDMPQLVGREAERRLARSWQNTFFDLKTLLGATFEEVQKIKSKWGFKLVPGKKGLLFLEVETEGGSDRMAPQEIVAKLFAKLKETAEEALHQKVNSVTISVPVNMSEYAKEALHEAARLAGFNEDHLICDPAAAVIAYDLDQPSDTSGVIKNVVIVDFGATVNVSLVKLQGGLIKIARSETNGLTAAAMEKELMNHFGLEFKRKTGLDYTESRRAIVKLQYECERVKKDLSQMQQSNIQLDGFHEGCDLNATITRARFEAMIDNLIKTIITPIQNVVNYAGGIDKVNYVILSGGSVKIPKVQGYIKQFFSGNSGVQILSSIDPLEVCARGAAIQSSLITSRNPMLNKLKKSFQATNLSIGISDKDGNFIRIIPKESVIPLHVTKSFGVAPNQNKFLMTIYEGEYEIAKENHLLGQFIFQFQANADKIQFSFIIDTNGQLRVTGNCNGKSETFKLEGVKSKLSTEEASNYIK